MPITNTDSTITIDKKFKDAARDLSIAYEDERRCESPNPSYENDISQNHYLQNQLGKRIDEKAET